MRIPLYDLIIKEDVCVQRINNAINKIISDHQFVLGDEVQIFEKHWAKFCNYKYAIGLNSGTDALEAIIRSYNFKKGSGFIVPVNTYTSTGMAICNAGHIPVFIDCDENYGMNLEKLEQTVKNNKLIKGIIPVHLYGIPENISEINKLARENNLIVIEDSAQAHGLQVPEKNDKMFSFYPTKNLGAFGDGGIAITDSIERALWIERWRNQGRITGDTIHHEILGVNSRLDTLQAAILDIKLDYLNCWNHNRYKTAQLYYELLDNTDIILPPNKGVFHLFVIRVKERNRILNKLKEIGIGCSIHYPIPLHLQNAYSYIGYKKEDFRTAEKLSEEIISLPMHPYLKEEEIIEVCNAIKKSL